MAAVKCWLTCLRWAGTIRRVSGRGVLRATPLCGLVAAVAVVLAACEPSQTHVTQDEPSVSVATGVSAPVVSEPSLSSTVVTGSGSVLAGNFSVELMIEVQGEGNFSSDDWMNCAGTGSYAGFRQGGVVQVFGDGGEQIATASIESLGSHVADVVRLALGPYAPEADIAAFGDKFVRELESEPAPSCLMWLTVHDVPSQAVYRLQVADQSYEVPGPLRDAVEGGHQRFELPWSVGCSDEPACASMWQRLGIPRFAA